MSAEAFALEAMTELGVSVTKEGSQYICTVTPTENGHIDAESVHEAARDHDLQVDHTEASIERGELYVYVDSNIHANGGGS